MGAYNRGINHSSLRGTFLWGSDRWELGEIGGDKEGSLILIVWLNLVCKMIIFMVLNNLTLNYLLKLNLLDFTNLSLKIFSRFFISEIGRCLIVDGLIVTV